jgi:LysR family glycine cleavage system transcriptional activator
MSATLPPLNALRAFEAAARQLSFTRAAQELHVTQTAISHQIRLLEQHLDLRLFVRLPRQLALTNEGQGYARELGRVFDQIGDATSALRAAPRREILAVTCLPSFASRWLVPRLPGFAAAHPQYDLRLSTTERQIDFTREAIDVGIRWGFGRYTGLRVQKLLDDEYFPVCSPRLLARRGRLDLRRQALLHDDSPDLWRRWLRAAGITGVDPERGHIFSDASLMLQLALEGHGVALGRRSLVQRELTARRLCRPFPAVLPSERAYYLVASPANAELPRVKAFERWLLDELARFGAAPAGKPRATPAGSTGQRRALP